jgi:hypothetical protein
MKAYAGIGSRETPAIVLEKMEKIAAKLSSLDYILYSGGAQGADTAFENGADKKIIFLPWDGFNDRTANGIDYIVPPFNASFVEKYHPKPKTLSNGASKLMSRNSYQVLGPDLSTPVKFVLCWTKDGKMIGGTSFAIRIAKSRNIPVFNLAIREDERQFGEFILRSNFFP